MVAACEMTGASLAKFLKYVGVARLEDILRSKIAADRPKDRQDVLIIREMLARQTNEPRQ